jgi:hypothetical protein
MLKKIKSKSSKTNSMLDFVLELNQKYNIKNTKLDNKADNKKLEREKRKLQNQKSLTNNYFNDQLNSQEETLIKKNFKEDQENINHKNIPKRDLKLALVNNNKTITDFFKQKIPENKLNSHINNHQNYYNLNNLPNDLVKNVNVKSEKFSKRYVIGKGKFIEFFDEINKKNIKFPLYEEKEFKFCKSKILPQIKVMNLDNDVLTDEEQIKDAASMLRDNIKESIKAINNEGKDYLNKNLSRKLKKK